MITRKLDIVVAFLLAVPIVALPSAEAWKQFHSSVGFSAMYPGWFVIGKFAGSTSTPQFAARSRRYYSKRGQAEIVMTEAPGSSTRTLAQVIEYYTQGASVLSRRDIVTRVGSERGCSGLKEVVSKETAVPSKDSPIPVSYIISTDFFCVADGHKIATLLRNWEGDQGQERYQQVALQMAKSIHIER